MIAANYYRTKAADCRYWAWTFGLIALMFTIGTVIAFIENGGLLALLFSTLGSASFVGAWTNTCTADENERRALLLEDGSTGKGGA